MKKTNWGIMAVLAAFALAAGLAACNNGNNGSGGSDIRPDAPETMSGLTAMEYFRQNNITAGWNLGNTLDAINFSVNKAEETGWDEIPATQQLFNGVKESGFDMVRIPCTWLGHIGSAPNYKVSEARLKRVAEVIGYAKTAGIKAVVINIHHDGNYTDPSAGTWGFVDLHGAVNDSTKKNAIENQLAIVWTQIAEYFKNYGDYLIFETLNEVHGGTWGSLYKWGEFEGYTDQAYQERYQKEQDILFDWNSAALKAIRDTGGNNLARFVAVPGLGSTEPYVVNAANARGKLLPNDGANGTGKLIVAAHFYDPPIYTVEKITGLIHTWGTSAEKNHLAHEIGTLKTNFIDNGIAVYFGEWGAPTDLRSSMSQTIKDTHLDYIGAVAAAARANTIVPCYWDCDIFKILERSNGKPKTGLWADTLKAMMDVLK